MTMHQFIKTLLGGTFVAAMLVASGAAIAASNVEMDKRSSFVDPPMSNTLNTKTEAMTDIKGTPDRVLSRTDRDEAVIGQVERVLEPSYSSLSVDAQMGTVFIRGTVDNNMDRNAVITKVRSVNGVDNVNIDGLTVRNQ